MFNSPKIFGKITLRVAIVASAFASCVNVQAETGPLETIEVYGEKISSHGLGLNENNGTSNRLGLTAMQLPASMEILSREKINARGDYSALSAITRATGFVSSANPGNGGTSTAVRGFNGHSSVAYTYDGIRLYVGAGTVTFPADTWTVEKVELLRGPGSVINGVGAIGATVNYAPKAPAFTQISSEVNFAAGENDLLRIAVGSGGKLNEKLAYRFDAVSHESNGYVDNGDEARHAVAASLLFRANESLDVKFSVDYAETKQSAYWGTPLVNGKIIDSTRDNNYNVEDGLVEYEDLWPRLSVQWQVNESTIFRNDSFYLKADRHWRNVESYDYNSTTGLVDRSFYLEILHEQEQWGSRSDLLIDFNIAGLPTLLSVGAEVNSIDFTHFNNRPYTGSSSVDLNAPAVGRWADGVQSQTSKDFTSETMQIAFFADFQVELNDHLSLVSGIRNDQIGLDREDFARSNAAGHSEAAAKIDTDFSGTSWRVGAVYQVDSTTSIYAQISDAQDSIQSILSATNTDLDLAEGRQYEIGIKQLLWDERLQYTLAVYDIEKENLLSLDPGGIEAQIGKQSSQGIEFDTSFKLTDSLSIDFNVALTNPEFDDFVKSSGDLSGNTPKNVARKTSNLWVYWSPSTNWLLNGGVRYVGERYSSDTNSSKIPSYSVIDANIQWLVSDSLQLSFRGKNLTGEKNFVLSPYGNQWVLAQDRSYEVGLNYSFN